MSHRLDPLLKPRSVAVVGASAREDSMGEWSLVNLQRGGYQGAIYPVNPGYEEIRGQQCHAAIADLPETPDLAIFAVGDGSIEAALDAAIERGVPAGVIMSSLAQDDEGEPNLRTRIRRKIDASGMLVCGANGMGFYNVRDGVWACGFDSSEHAAPGNAALISHSGSGMSGIIDCEERLRINFAVSTGNELSVTMDEYLDYVLDFPETRVVGLFVETARRPAGFRAALEKAADRGIPIVALKVGRTEESAALAVSHSGAMAGDDATYDALFDRYGVHRVDDMDELATAMILFAELPPLGPGGLVTLHDSGGERQLIADLARAQAVPLTELNAETTARLEAALPHELPAINPLDGWSRGGPDAGSAMTEYLTIMMQDPGAAIGAVIHDRAPYGGIYRSYGLRVQAASRASGKPAALVAARQGTGSDPLVVELTQRGYPVLDGVTPFLRGVRGLMNYRDFRERRQRNDPAPDAAAVAKWQARLREGGVADELTALGMLADFGLPVVRAEIVESTAALASAAAGREFPLVLKTAMPGITHKTESRGVILDIADTAGLEAGYRDLCERLGPRVLLADMAPQGVEMILGARRDPQFGPVVMLGFGGIHAEVMRDVAFLLPPFGEADARRRLDELALRATLDGVRGRPAADVGAFCRMAAGFSAMVHALGSELAEVDINPVIVTSDGCLAVDALVVAAAPGEDSSER